MEVGEHDERQGQRQPAVEVAAVAAVPQPEPDRGNESEDGEKAVGGNDRSRAPTVGVGRLEVEPEEPPIEPQPEERDRHEQRRPQRVRGAAGLFSA